MRASDWRATLPAGNTEAELEQREQLFLSAIASGQFVPLRWSIVESTWDKYTLRIGVTSDALRVGELGDCVRITLSERGQQAAADLLKIHLCPIKVDDLAWAAAQVRLAPHTMSATPADVAVMATTDRMFAHSEAIDEAGGDASSDGMLVRNVGKIWTVTRAHWIDPTKIGAACNYGWHGPSFGNPAATPPGQTVIQPPGYKHPLFPHWDYSQTAVFASPDAELVNNETGELQSIALDAVSCDPVLWHLVQHDGPHPLRHPGVPCPLPSSGDGTTVPGCPLASGFTPPAHLVSGGKTPALPSGISMARRLMPLGVVGATIATLAALGELNERRA